MAVGKSNDPPHKEVKAVTYGKDHLRGTAP